MSPNRILLKGGCVLTLDKQVGNFHKANVLIEGAKIAAVGPRVNAGDAEVIDASDMIVMPGFVDSHRHMWEGILRNLGTDFFLEGERSHQAFVLNKIAPTYRPEDVYIGTYTSALGAIDAGITSVLDWSHIQTTPDHTSQNIQALRDSGIRAVFGYGFPWWKDTNPDQAQQFRETAKQYFSSKDQLLTLALAPQGPEFTAFETAKSHWELAREVDARISVHVGVGSFGKQGKLAQMGKAGLLKDDTTYVHCTTLSDEEILMIVNTGGKVSMSAAAEMMMGHGMVPIQQFLNRGLHPSLSVDAETHVSGDMFTQMRAVISLQHGLLFERRLAGEWNVPRLLTAREVLEFATLEGARANGLEAAVGTLTPGKEADIILLNTNRINIMPINDPIGAVVWGMDTSNVDSVFVAGKALKRGGKLLNVDLNRVQDQVYAARDYVIKASGVTLPTI